MWILGRQLWKDEIDQNDWSDMLTQSLRHGKQGSRKTYFKFKSHMAQKNTRACRELKDALIGVSGKEKK